jgi:hypothetical protein
LQNGSVADELGNIVGDAQALAFDALCLHSTGYGRGSRASIGNKAVSRQLSAISEIGMADNGKLIAESLC